MVEQLPQTGASSERAVDIVAQAAGRLFERWGYRNVVGRTWAHCLLSLRPVDAVHLQERLSISSGALSMALGDLVKLGLVYRETGEHGRRFYYFAERDLWIIATRIFRERERKRLEEVLQEIRMAEQMLSTISSTGGDDREIVYQLEQVRRLVGLGEFVVGLLDAMMERTKVELKAAQKWLSVSGKIGGEPLSRLRRAINASRLERKSRRKK